jgi:uncharacterized protein (TIGR03083 family)
VSENIASTRVDATPLWNVHDVIAHLAGITQDAASGNMAGVTTDSWTAAQVARGRDLTLADLISIWDANAPGLEAFLSSPEGPRNYAAVLDIHTHEADLLTATGQPVDLPRDFLAWMRPLLQQTFNEAVASAGLPPVEVTASDLQWFRGRLGRRTQAEVGSYGWSANPEPYFNTWFIFGQAETSLGETSTTDSA